MDGYMLIHTDDSVSRLITLSLITLESAQLLSIACALWLNGECMAIKRT